jgi:hypothetical protein
VTRAGDLQLAGVVDNAMLYKDLTQWLRNRTFVFLFFGLLTVAEVITVFVVLLPPTQENAGAVAFGFLSAVLFVYAVIIAFLGHNLTAREFFNQTFELYELSGMSLERMAWGKLVSMLTQFLFGFFCLVPFMFVSFMLGGLDFYLVITTSVLLVLAVVPLYLLALFVALLSKSRQVSGVVRGVILVFVFLLLPWWGGLAIVGIAGFGGTGSPVEFMKSLMLLDPAAIRSTLIFLAFYVQICLLLFYACCNAISPSTDSRATAIQLISVLLTASYLALWCSWAWNGFATSTYAYLTYVPLALLFLILGLVTFYSRLDIPIMAANRQRRARFPVTRLVYACFHAGSKGAVKTLAICYGLCVASYALTLSSYGVTSFAAGGTPGVELHHAASTALQMPFFLAVPAWPLILAPQFRRNMAALRTVVLACWIVLGIPLMIMMIIVNERATYYGAVDGQVLMQGLAVLLSPLSSVFVLADGFVLMRIILGVGGLLGMDAIIRARVRREPICVPTEVLPQG